MKLRVNGNQLEVMERKTLTSGSVGIYTVEFAFVDGWEGMLCSAVFRANNQVKVAPLDEYGRCVIPHESLAATGELLVGAFGVRDSNVVLTTEYASAGRIAQGAERDGDPSLDPEQPAYERILAEVYDLRRDIAEFEYSITASEAGRVAAEVARQAAEQARADETAGIVAQASAHADRAAGVAVRTPYVSHGGTWMVWDRGSGTFRDSGIPAQGPQGAQGNGGALAELGTGVFAMSLSEDGHLLLSVNDREIAPPLVIDRATGHLIYEII